MNISGRGVTYIKVDLQLSGPEGLSPHDCDVYMWLEGGKDSQGEKDTRPQTKLLTLVSKTIDIGAGRGSLN